MGEYSADRPSSLWLHGLELENIGPFVKASLSFCHEEGEPAPVTLLTGQSGTGKTLVLDAIRDALSWVFAQAGGGSYLHDNAMRVLLRHGSSEGRVRVDAHRFSEGVRYRRTANSRPQTDVPFTHHAKAQSWALANKQRLVFDYWDTSLPAGQFAVANFSRRNYEQFQDKSLTGRIEARSITDLICQFDYLRSSDDEGEKRTGQALMEATKKIAELAMLDGGRFVRVERSTFTPLFEQAGSTVSIDQLSTGNTYLVSRLLTLLGRMHSAQVVNNLAPEQMLLSPGLLLIDEVEAHLHPRWQSRILPGIRQLFPNVQIIATTHSPFVLASVPDAKVHTTRLASARDACEIVDSTRDYSVMPIEGILASEAFDFTLPFGPEIAKLFSDRLRALDDGRFEDARRIEDKLIERNPEHFAWMRLRPLEGAAE
ncbi:MAG: AAA family ATPase [Myxococcales bacterium]|nr:AAA family ATPase [Myxococcales bacterium]